MLTYPLRKYYTLLFNLKELFYYEKGIGIYLELEKQNKRKMAEGFQNKCAVCGQEHDSSILQYHYFNPNKLQEKDFTINLFIRNPKNGLPLRNLSENAFVYVQLVINIFISLPKEYHRHLFTMENIPQEKNV